MDPWDVRRSPSFSLAMRHIERAKIEDNEDILELMNDKDVTNYERIVTKLNAMPDHQKEKARKLAKAA